MVSNTFITASNMNTGKSNEFKTVTDDLDAFNNDPSLDDLTTRIDKPETIEKGSNHGIIRRNQKSSNVNVEDVYCYTNRRIGLIEQLLTTNTVKITLTDKSSSEGNDWPSCSYLLSNENNLR